MPAITREMTGHFLKLAGVLHTSGVIAISITITRSFCVLKFDILYTTPVQQKLSISPPKVTNWIIKTFSISQFFRGAIYFLNCVLMTVGPKFHPNWHKHGISQTEVISESEWRIPNLCKCRSFTAPCRYQKAETPVLIRTLKLSSGELSQYLDGRSPGN